MDLILSKKKNYVLSRVTNFRINPRHFYKNFFSLVENTFLKLCICVIYTRHRCMHGASFIHAFHIRILRFQGLGGRVAVGSCCLLSSTLRQRSPPYTGCIKSWKMDILIRAYIDKQSLLLRHCLLSPWWFMGDAYRVYYARNNISLTRDSRTFE